MKEYTVCYQQGKDTDMWLAYVPELDGCHTQVHDITKPEAVSRVVEAIQVTLGDECPKKFVLNKYVFADSEIAEAEDW